MVLKWVEDSLTGCANPKAIPGCKQLLGAARGWRCRVGSYRIKQCILNINKVDFDRFRASDRRLL